MTLNLEVGLQREGCKNILFIFIHFATNTDLILYTLWFGHEDLSFFFFLVCIAQGLGYNTCQHVQTHLDCKIIELLNL